MEGIAALPACTQICVAFARSVAISDIISVEAAVKSREWLTQAHQHSVRRAASAGSLLQRKKLIKFHHSFSFKGEIIVPFICFPFSFR